MWCALALSAIVLAAGLTWSVMRLAGEHVGLASIPVSVVRRLTPGPGIHSTLPPERDTHRTVTETVTVSRTVTVPTSTAGVSTQHSTGPPLASSPTVSTKAAVTTTATSGVIITPAPVTRTTSDHSDDARERAGSGGARDD